MSSTTDVSKTLGEYMLKGWVLTDQPCPTPDCRVPLMRSPNGRDPVVHFCANCDGGPTNSESRLPHVPSDSSTSISSRSHVSRSSTPLTEVSSTLSSPTFAPPETEESRRRREQSDNASSEIGKRLLKGWAMLADECPNVRCFGIPLVRPPKAGGGKDPRKECVICGTVYLTEVDTYGQERLVPAESASPATTEALPLALDKGKTVLNKTQDEMFNAPYLGISEVPKVIQASPQPLHSTNSSANHMSATMAALDSSAQALELSLDTLSKRLTSFCSGQYSDMAAIGQAADAIGKCTQALLQVKQMQWNETQALFQ